MIRLEVRLRLNCAFARVVAFAYSGIDGEAQLVGLRFASDGEVAKLAERAMNEKLSQGGHQEGDPNLAPGLLSRLRRFPRFRLPASADPPRLRESLQGNKSCLLM